MKLMLITLACLAVTGVHSMPNGLKKSPLARANEETTTTEVADTETTTDGLTEDLEIDGELERMANSTMESNNTKAGNNTFVAAVEEAVEDVMEAAKGAADHVKSLINKHILGEDSEEKEEKVESEEDSEEKAEDEDESEKKVVGNKRNSRAESEDPKFVLRETNQKKVHKVVKAGEENLSDDHEEDESAEDTSDESEDSDESSESNATTTEAEVDATTEDAEFRDVTTEEPTTESDDVIATGGFVAENTDALKEDNKRKLPSTQAESNKKN